MLALSLDLSNTELDRLQLVLYATTRAVTEAIHVTPVLKSLHWLKIN